MISPMTTRIKKIRCIATAPAGIRLVIVKVETTEPGLYGLGCATFTQRPLPVIEAVEKYLDPFLRGRNVSEIEDIFLAANMSSYWHNGPVLGNALSGVDMALWDIKGKQAGMPVHDLLGGKCRKAAPVYVHASGRNFDEVCDKAESLRAPGLPPHSHAGGSAGPGHLRHQQRLAAFSNGGRADFAAQYF